MADSFGEAVVDFFGDLISLDVTTYTGDVDITGSGAGEELNLQEVFDLIKEHKASAKLRLVAHTHIAFDKDAVNFVAKDLTPGEASLVTAHKELVQASIEGRVAMVKALKGFIPGL
ncbi:MAG: hypothetical protein AAF414_18105 [Pseudomonadota bacterium]